MILFEWIERVCGCTSPSRQRQAFGLSELQPYGGSKIRENWGVNANCYAYAMNDRKPANAIGGAIPGGASGNVASLSATGDYLDKLVSGAIEDGLLHVEGSPECPPDDVSGTYLVALIASEVGFHWLRREPDLKRWSWKDGNSGQVRLNIFNVAEKRFVYIDDANLAELLSNGGNFTPWLYSQMRFLSFFRVPASGISVAGAPNNSRTPAAD